MASPQLLRLKQMLGVRSRDRFDLESYRRDFEKFARYFPPPAEVRVEAGTLAGIPCRRLIPPDRDGASTVLYLHGGGYISGSLTTHLELMARLARASGAEVVGIGYRRAPEHPFPAALDDALAAYRRLLAEGLDPGRLAVAGDSAGGGLAVALLTTLRDFGSPLPRAAALLSPWVDLALTGASLEDRREADKVLHPVILERAAELYLAGADPRDPRASPLFADLAGLPPLLVQVGTAELLFDDSRRLAAALERAGTPVELKVWDEMLHFWHFYASILPEGEAAIREAGVFLAEKLGREEVLQG